MAGNLGEVKESLNILSKSDNSLSEMLEKNPGKPSCPGALPLCIALIGPSILHTFDGWSSFRSWSLLIFRECKTLKELFHVCVIGWTF